MINMHFRYVHPTPSQNSETSFLISGSIVLKPVTHLLIMPKQSKRDAKPAEELPPKRRHTMKSPPDRGAEAEKTSARSEKARPLCLNKKFQKPKKDKKDKEKSEKSSPTETVGRAKSSKPVDSVKSEGKEARSTRLSALKKPATSATTSTKGKDKEKLAALKQRIDELGAIERADDSDGEDSSDDMEMELNNILQKKNENTQGEAVTEEQVGGSESEGSDDSEQEDDPSCDSQEAASSSEDGTVSEDDGNAEEEDVEDKSASIVPHEDPDEPDEPEKPVVRNSTWSLMLATLLSFPPSLRIRTLKIATK